MFKKTGKDLMITFTNKMNREKLWQNQKYHRKNHTQCKLKRERNIMFVCVENPRTSRYVMDLMQDQALDQKFSKQPKQDSLRFADVNTARMKPESVTELTAHYSQVYCKKKLFFL
jgi:7-keto-8-aminopelargonate synthetase-like enzyme